MILWRQKLKKKKPKNAGHDSVAGGDCTLEQQAFMPLIFRDFIPARAAHCQLGSEAAGSHTSWLLGNKQNKKQEKRRYN